jgi:hypothetical protein
MSDPTKKPGFLKRWFGGGDTPAEPITAPEAAPAVEAPAPQGWWQRLKQGLSRTSGQLGGRITDLFTKRKLDARYAGGP